ncbi:MAG: DUF2837 family protein [Candidatus Marinamargulisbacteria bacterium]|jgi:hypothetical protein|nr:hypothetical protein [bacterium]MDG2265110.1 DUF2837 family protein [Candidatus Marinamargulisbacteria bacterium]|tara:strand:- start:1153 stop:1977 length:825 start_codon:yes stop_codon:yes gene_type:complete
MTSLLIVCFFTGLIHVTESLVYSFRLAGIRTRQLAVALSFVTSTLLVSRLSNLFQAPLLGAMVDRAILNQTADTLGLTFRIIIALASLGSIVGLVLTPTAVRIFQRAVLGFQRHGSIIRLLATLRHARTWRTIWRQFQIPNLQTVRMLLGRWQYLPKSFLYLNVLVTAIYTIGVLCALYAGALLPEFRATAIQLSGLINGMATILLTLFVDPVGARITDQTFHNQRPESDVKATIAYLLIGRVIGTVFIAQILFLPFSHYLALVTRWLSTWLVV